MRVDVRLAHSSDLEPVKRLADDNRDSIGFLPRAAFQESIKRGWLLVAKVDGEPVGFVRFRPRATDDVCTLYEICVSHSWRRRGIGTLLLDALKAHAQHHNKRWIRLKCPTDLEANRFYLQYGFRKIGCSEGKARPLVEWAMSLDKPQFICAVSIWPRDLRVIVRLWQESGYPINPFERCLVTPLTADPSSLRILYEMKANGIIKELYFDSGGYHVQRGRISYSELCDRLVRLYKECPWADYFVLPDSPPSNGAERAEMYQRVKDTVEGSLRVFDQLPSQVQDRAFPVVQGVTIDQVHYCLERYESAGFTRVGFGSFGTNGRRSEVNVLDDQSRDLFRFLRLRFTGHIHAFGIGTPPVLWAASKLGADSLDSSAWMKAAGYGNVYLPYMRAYNITYRSLSQVALSPERFKVLKSMTHHECAFCHDLRTLSTSRDARIMHNLFCTVETLTPKLPESSIRQVLRSHSPRYERMIVAVERM
ncbi:MAG TPA: GNAT family N-acetyltransferase [Bacillota bacterium]|jgi:ribosomal protein S18 acetylase RimI-like enzyme|nr:GNAT family N-acetyltransferase [Bacillota bacterium]